MPEIFLKKTAYGLLPEDKEAADYLHGVKDNKILRCKVTQPRNYEFHKKAFALAEFLFDHWHPNGEQTYKGMTVQKDFERFREEITILSGFYTASYSVSGKVRLKAMSWSFGSMDQDTFERLYSALIDTGLRKILPETFTNESLRATVDELLAFA